MNIVKQLGSLTGAQKSVVMASFLGWTLDAFDYFLLVFVLKDIAQEFHADVTKVTLAILLTLAMRPLGAFIFGIVADRFGRRPTLMVDVLLYSALELASAFSPSLTVLIVLRALYGVAMGGEWGVGASLALETVPAETAASFPAFSRKAMPSAISWPPSPSISSSPFSAGAGCSSLASCRRFSFFTSAHTFRNRPPGRRSANGARPSSPPSRAGGACSFTSSC